MSDVVLAARNLRKHFAVRGGVLMRPRGQVHAVDDVSLEVRAGETLGVVGESGCGKSTLGRALLWLDPPDAGEVELEGVLLRGRSRAELRALRQRMQIVFQDPQESLNARHTVGDIVREPLDIHRIGTPAERHSTVQALLERVGLSASAAQRFPHEFSGGQRQRIGIARAIALRPRLLVCDEAVSALDVSVRAQIVNLLLELQREMGLAMVFIAHDLTVVKHVSDQVAVMYLGQVVELASAERLYSAPRHPYTRALISAIPDHRRLYGETADAPTQRVRLLGEVPSPIDPPTGCRFHTRCAHAVAECQRVMPQLEQISASEAVRCHRWREL